MNYFAKPIIPLIDQSHLRNDIMFKQFCPSLKSIIIMRSAIKKQKLDNVHLFVPYQ